MAESVVVDLLDNLTIASVEEIHKQLDSYAIGSQDIVFNAGHLEPVDTARLQTLYAFHQALKSHSGEMSWSSKSDALIDAAKLLGLTDHLALG